MATSQRTATSATAVRDVEQKPEAGDQFIHYDHIGHGSTPAAWTLCGIVMVGALLAAVGFIGLAWTEEWVILIWIGAALMPVAVVAGVVMKRMGYGVEMDSQSVLARGADPRPHSGPVSPDHTSGGEEKRAPQRSTS